MLHLDEATLTGGTPADRRSRFGGAAGTSIATHALIVLAAWGVMRLTPATSATRGASIFDPTSIVFRGLDSSGPSGDNGGNRSTTLAPRAQTHPRDAVAVVVAPPPPLQPPPTITPELTRPPDAPILPLVPMDAGQVRQVGTIAGPSAPPSDGRGPGDHGVGTGKDGDGPGLPGHHRGVGDGLPGNGDGVRPPQILYKTQPQYTTDAMRAKLQGVAILSGIVGPDGSLHDIRIIRSLDGTFGLDQEAIKCVQQWRFRPGSRSGTPVPVAVTLEVGFNLR